MTNTKIARGTGTLAKSANNENEKREDRPYPPETTSALNLSGASVNGLIGDALHPWYEGIRFHSAVDREKAIQEVQQYVAAQIGRFCNARDQHEKQMAYDYELRVQRLEADLREAYGRNASHLIDRAREGNRVVTMGGECR